MGYPIMTRARLLALLVVAVATMGPAWARPASRPPAERHALLLPFGTQAPSAGETYAPVGWLDLCKRQPQECRVDRSEPLKIILSSDNWAEIVFVNKSVNARIRPLPDLEHWGLIESWDYPEDGSGDCEDYVLEKRKLLVAAGLPRRTLLITVVLDEAGAGHAVLIVRTDRGDFVLDNKRDTVLSWNTTGYTYIKLENQRESGWLAFGNQRANAATATLSPAN